MTRGLISLGSNVGDREATLRAALEAIDALPDVHLRRQSAWHASRPIGGPPGQSEFLNAAAVIEASAAPLLLLDELQDIEKRYGREHAERWGPRTLDIDLLLYGNTVAETEMLTLPHPRMSYRRFVLEPAAEVAPRMLHPVIGWPVERLLTHLNEASDQLALLAPSEHVRTHYQDMITERFGARSINPPSFAVAEQLWPSSLAVWLAMPASGDPKAEQPAATRRRGGKLRYAASEFPKLSILLDSGGEPGVGIKSQWSAVARRPGRGPMLRLQTINPELIAAEIAAAIEAVWPNIDST